MRALPLALLLSAALGAGCCRRVAAAPAAAPATPAAPPVGGRVVPGEYVVTLAPGADAKVLEDALAGLPPREVRALGGGAFLLAFRAEDPGLAALDALRAREPRIQAVQPNLVYRATR